MIESHERPRRSVPAATPARLATPRIAALAVVMSLVGTLTLRVAAPATAAGPGDVTAPTLIAALEWTGPNSPIHDVILLWDDRLDASSIPDPTDFDVRLDGVPMLIDRVEYSHDGTFDPSLSLAFLTLFLHDAVPGSGALTVSYTPGATPVKDQAGNVAEAVTSMEVSILDVLDFEIVLGLVDGSYGASHVGVVLSEPIDPASLPPASAFTVTRNGTPMTPTAIAIFPKFNNRILDLTVPVTFRSGDTGSISYTAPGGGGMRDLAGAAAPNYPDTDVFLLLAALDASTGTVGAGGGTVSTDAGSPGTTAQDPVATTVAVGGPATISIAEGANPLPPPTGEYAFIGETVNISVEPPGSPAAPIAIDFAIDASALTGAGATPDSVQVFRNGVMVPACTGAPGTAAPDPCLESRTPVPAAPDPLAYVVLRVLTSHASAWNFGRFTPYVWSGFQAPIDNLPTINDAKAGSAIPIKFSLGGDRGLTVFQAGSPSSQAIACGTGFETAPVEELSSPGAATLSYSASTGRYTYVWKSQKGWTGCRKLILAFRDGSTQTAVFRFR